MNIHGLKKEVKSIERDIQRFLAMKKTPKYLIDKLERLKKGKLKALAKKRGKEVK